MKKFFAFLILLCGGLLASGADPRPVLLLGHGSDTWKVRKTLTDGNIVAEIIRTWPAVKSYSGYSAVYIGESVQSIALEPWNKADFEAIKKFVSQGGTMIFTGDTAFQLTGKKETLDAEYRKFFGFKGFTVVPQGKNSSAQITSDGFGLTKGEKNSGWMRNVSLAATGVADAKVFMDFNVNGKNFVAATENNFGKGKVYFISPTLHRVAGNGELQLGYYSAKGKWTLTAQGNSADKLAKLIFALFDRLPDLKRVPAKYPAGITGGDAARVSLALKNSDIDYLSVKRIEPADFSKYSLVYIGETLKYDKKKNDWCDPAVLKTVRTYLENGGVIITSGEIPYQLAGRKRNLGEIGKLFGFSAFPTIANSAVKDFVFTAPGKALKNNAGLTGASEKWNNRVDCHAGKISTATVLGEFKTTKGNIPAFTVNKVGKGTIYWLATNPFRLVPNRNEILGDPDDFGIFVLNERGRAASDLQKLFVTLFKTQESLKLRKDFPEKSQWGLIPLGKPGNLKYPAAFPKKVVYQKLQPVKNAFLLSKDGAAQAVIVAPDKSSDKLAGELTAVLKEITGADFKTVRKIPAEGNAIVLFNETNAPLVGRDLKNAALDTMIVETDGNRIFVGGKEMGAGLAVHYLLEKFGCRKLWPGKSGTIIPKTPTLYAPQLNLNITPKISVRAVRYKRTYYPRAAQNSLKCGIDLKNYLDSTLPGLSDFFGWHGIISNRERGGKWAIGLSHSSKGNFYQRFGKIHPEYFALQSNGSRSQDSSPLRYRLCHSNKNMIKQLAAECIRAIEAAPGTKVVSIPLCDGGGTTFCMCKKCRELDPVNAVTEWIPFLQGMTTQKVKYVSLSDRVLTFSNAVAEIVTEKYPDVKVYMYIYSHYNAAPVKVKPHPSLLVLVANMNYTKESMRQNHLRDMMKFSGFPGEYYWRTNAMWGFNSVLAPQDYARKVFEDIQVFKKNLISGTDIDCFEHHWAFKTLTYYSLVKGIWNPDRLSFDDVADDFCKSGFGPAAAEMREFFTIVEKATNAAANAEGEYLDFFDEKVIAALRSQLAKARAKAANDPAVLERIGFIAIGVDGGELNRKLYLAKKKNDSVEYEALRRQFISFIRETNKVQPFALYPAYLGQYNLFVK